MRKSLFALAVAAIGVAAFTLVTACGDDGPSDTQYQKVRQELQDQQNANQQLQAQLADAKKGGGGAATQATATGTAAGSPTAAAAGLITLLTAKTVTPAPPAPTPTPLPAGVTAVPRATPLASYYESVGPYFIYVETLVTTSASKYNVASTVACTPSGVFARGQRIVFRYDIVDMATGKRLTDKDGTAGTVVKVILPNGDESVGRWSQRGGGQVPDAPWMFSSNWDIPTDFPLGVIDFKINIVTKDGKSFTWTPPFLSSVPLKEDTRPKVVQ